MFAPQFVFVNVKNVEISALLLWRACARRFPNFIVFAVCSEAPWLPYPPICSFTSDFFLVRVGLLQSSGCRRRRFVAPLTRFGFNCFAFINHFKCHTYPRVLDNSSHI